MTASVVVAAVAILLLVVVLLAVRVAARLDRLHRRTEAAWAALDGLLARRAVVVRTLVAAGGVPPDEAGPLRTAAERALAAGAEREATENELVGLLATLDRVSLEPALAGELAEAEQRVVIGRRVYNDAVRDTRTLRGRRSVRWLRLAGTAPRPRFFEIAEPVVEPLLRPARSSARVLLVDREGRVLLFCCTDPRGPFWCTPGGGLEPGEDLRGAAVRELAEETGLAVGSAAFTGPVWFRRARFALQGREVEGREWFFLLRVDRHDLPTAGFSRSGRSTVLAHRWWSCDELAASADTVYPVELAAELPALLAAPWDGTTHPIR